MKTLSAAELDQAKLDPGSVFQRPEDVLATSLSTDDKKTILLRWEEDADDLMRATGEGMPPEDNRRRSGGTAARGAGGAGAAGRRLRLASSQGRARPLPSQILSFKIFRLARNPLGLHAFSLGISASSPKDRRISMATTKFDAAGEPHTEVTTTEARQATQCGDDLGARRLAGSGRDRRRGARFGLDYAPLERLTP